MQPTKPPFAVVVADEQLISHAGVGLLAELADRLGLTRALARLAVRHPRSRRRRHQPAKVLRDLIVMLADGGDCLSDLRLLSGGDELLGPVASVPTAWRMLEAVAKQGDDGLAALRAARAHARARAWDAGGWPARRPILDLDATLLTCHSDRKQGAAGTYKHTFGFHPLLAYLDRGDGLGEALAGILRPGNATANNATDHLAVLELALAQLPAKARRRLLVRTDSAGATQAFLAELRARKLHFSVGLAIDAHIGQALLALPESAWRPAITPAGQPRAGAQVAEVTGWLDLGAYPPGTRCIARRERPHPGARHKLRFTDPQGRRYQALLTDQPGADLARLELRHRQHARVEDRIRAAKATGLANLPFDAWRRNAVWLELVLAAQDLTGWLQTLLLDGELAIAEPKRLRTRLLHTAGRLVTCARRLTLYLSAAWPWATALASAFTRLRRLLPTPAG